MINPLDERRIHSGSQFAVRVAVLSGLALVFFAVIFFRLWYLQVLSGEEYLAQATDNRIREIKIQAPRGEILDADGKRPRRQPQGAVPADPARGAAAEAARAGRGDLAGSAR